MNPKFSPLNFDSPYIKEYAVDENREPIVDEYGNPVLMEDFVEYANYIEEEKRKRLVERELWESYYTRLPEGMRFPVLPENCENMEVLETLEGHTGWVITLQVLPDGTIVSGGRDRTIKIWGTRE